MVETRLLQGAMGRLYFIGEPSTLALLQTIRIIVEGTVGPSPFTEDSQRHRLLDSPRPRKTSVTPTAALPNRKKAKMLAHSFFTYGNMELLDARALWQCIDICYQDVLAIKPSDLCMIHLVLAIGSSMGRSPGEFKTSHKSAESEVDSGFEPDASFQVAEKMLCDLSDPGQPDVWVIQALTLCSVYHLISSRRNAAEECHRRAVSLSLAMGFHKSWEPNIVHSKQETTLRRRIWSSLFILDRFLAASLGHPLAICDADHPVSRAVTEVRVGEATRRWIPGGILEASHRLGRALSASGPSNNVTPNDLSSDTAPDFYSTDVSIGMPQARRSAVDIAHALALLHWKLVEDHATILRHRDAFLTLFLQKSRKIQQTKAILDAARPDDTVTAPCAIAATQSIRLAKDALDAEILPTRTPFLM
ncbi:fungal specific transcription factor domain-containing protein [Sarocladium implicatum]|nr:fungal specific transcription factor domain-containing protein [Sarocladium implicatum]